MMRWTDEQVANLNAYQRCGWVHPFTCPNDRGVLVATSEGWECPDCEYTQDWAHEHMFKGVPPSPMDILRACGEQPTAPSWPVIGD